MKPNQIPTTLPTYAESRDLAAFDWNHALDHPHEYQLSELIALSGQWTTCACGNMCSIIPRYSDGEPKDPRLITLGIQFANAVANKNFINAKITLHAIEERSNELMNKILHS